MEIESWNEVYFIMPEWAIKKWESTTDDQAIHEQIRLQVQAYLDGIGRTEPIRETDDMDLSLSGMYVNAQNFIGWVDEAYPLWTTTKERLDQRDGQRYLYTRAWQPNPDGLPDAQVETKYGLMTQQGTTGIQTLSKSRKKDGQVLETTAILVERERLVVSMRSGMNGAAPGMSFPLIPGSSSTKSLSLPGRAHAAKKDVRLLVFVTPDLRGPRAAGGKAAVSMKDWIVVLAKQGRTMCVLYETTPGSHRVGWVDAYVDP
ncbi:MAG: hypothetical protein ACOX62_00050 [Christensenellales bacterium]